MNALARTFSTMLDRSCESGHFVLLLILEENFQPFTTEYYAISCPVIHGPHCVEISISSPLSIFKIIFIMEECCILSNVLSAFFEMAIWFLSFILLSSYLLICIIFTDLCMLNQTFIPGTNPIWSWGMILLMCFWVKFASVLVFVENTLFISYFDP